ncbi:MAG: UDP-3-O-acyl-N-acetylglucosamine deacetylase [Candidatus Gastranaerophilales bacterium]|nr:UDP-3-O-acyl-N-acetylglucosamine deacetylase [Candidatus Gastranaerophilales bacterium]
MVALSGKGLMSGVNSTLTITKTNEGGIRFSNNGNVIPALANNIVSTSNFVVLGNQEVQFCLIEHLMASLAFCNVKNALIELDGKEVPILDGSAKQWVEEIKKEGLNDNSEIEQTEFKQPITYIDGDTEIALIPSDSLKITYLVNFNHKDLKNKWVTFEPSKNDAEIYEARTFGYLNDLEKFHQMGIALGADLNNTVGLKEDDTYTCELRSELEPAKHKILDIIGDLHLTGRNPLGFKAHIIAKLAGHKSHVEFAKKIIEELQ